MSDRGTDLLAAVLEHEHEIDIVTCAERDRALGPQLDHGADVIGPERPEAGIVIRRVQHDLTPIVGHRRPTVAEPAHVIVVWGFEPAGAERAVRRRQVRTTLPTSHDMHERAEEWINPLFGSGHVTTVPHSPPSAQPLDVYVALQC